MMPFWTATGLLLCLLLSEGLIIKGMSRKPWRRSNITNNQKGSNLERAGRDIRLSNGSAICKQVCPVVDNSYDYFDWLFDFFDYNYDDPNPNVNSCLILCNVTSEYNTTRK